MWSFLVVYLVLATFVALIIGLLIFGFKMAMTPVSSLPPGFDLEHEAEKIAARCWERKAS